MKSTFVNLPLLAAFATAGLLSCASSAGSADTADSSQTLSRTEAMAGRAEADEAQADTVTRQIDYNAMFSGVANTAAYDLAALAKMDPNLSTFAVLMEQADLTHALTGEDEEFTIFAPSNQAFADWPADSVSALMRPEHKAQLIRLLQAHMLLGARSALSLASSQSIETSGGEYVSVETDGDTLTVGGATVVRPDVRASNGVLHVVDGVLRTADDIVVDQ
ncbi:fasciclin domain-containing protein [Pontibacter litorisediminis]|uniref:fasciclin domain-containing protein n=1 Tax=Pontibacter litorisediminis TaxID=1846260 RepID=UPI0023EADFA7|nr:fasciclin domain-containing protein [Pontibacter litorisediminis]